MANATASTHGDNRRGSATAPAARDPESQNSKQGTAGHAGKTVGLLLACTNLVVVLAVLCTTAFYFSMRGNQLDKLEPLTQMQRASWNMIETFKPNHQFYYNIRSIHERQLFFLNSSRLVLRLQRSLQSLGILKDFHFNKLKLSNDEMKNVARTAGYPQLVHHILDVNRTFYEFIEFVPQHNIKSEVQKMQILVDVFMSQYFTCSDSGTVRTTFLPSPLRSNNGEEFVSEFSLDRIWLGAEALAAQMLKFLTPNIPKFVEQVRVHGTVQLNDIEGTPISYYQHIYTEFNNVCRSFEKLCSMLADIGLALADADLKKK